MKPQPDIMRLCSIHKAEIASDEEEGEEVVEWEGVEEE